MKSSRLLDASTRLLCAIVLLSTVLLTDRGFAQDFPSRPITMIVPFPGGGGADAVPRVTLDAFSASLGQPVIIENRPGAGGTTGTNAVARAAPDGYTLLLTVVPPITMNIFLQKSFPYDPRTAFVPVALTAFAPIVMVVNSSLPVNSLTEFISYVKQNPGKLSYGSAGVGTGQHIAGELLKQRAGIDMVHVPYRGSALIIQDMLVGSIQVGFGTPPAVSGFVAEGKLRMLAVTEANRFPDLPNLPTIDEIVPGVITNTWYGLFVPAGTPEAIVERLNHAMNVALKDAKVVSNFKLQGMLPAGGTPAEFAKLVRDDLEHWGKVIPSIGLKPQ